MTETNQTAYLAGGCFWGMEELVREIPGVLATEAGYTGGSTPAATYEQVKTGRTGHAESLKIVFDPKEAMAFDGCTGPYLLYSYARMRSILKKGAHRAHGAQVTATLPVEHKLLVALAKYPEVVFAAGQTLRLSTVPQYLFDLCKTFSEFYDQAPVLSAEPEVAAFRLRLVSAAAQTLENGLGLLGIEPVAEM